MERSAISKPRIVHLIGCCGTGKSVVISELLKISPLYRGFNLSWRDYSDQNAIKDFYRGNFPLIATDMKPPITLPPPVNLEPRYDHGTILRLYMNLASTMLNRRREALAHLRERRYHLIFMEQAFLSFRPYLEANKMRMTLEDFEVVKKFSKELFKMEDGELKICLTCQPKVMQQRIACANREGEEPITAEYLDMVDKEFLKMARQMNIRVIDTTDISLNEITMIIEDIINTF